MTRRKRNNKPVVVLLLVVLLLAALLGSMIWFISSHFFVGGKAYRKNAQQLDLRDRNVRIAEYEAIRAELPDCEIRWSIPFQGSAYPDDTAALSVQTLSDADLQALAYFTELVGHIRGLDSTRPISNVTETTADRDTVGHLFDVVGVNRYYSWYFDLGNLDSIYPRLVKEFRQWHEKTGKPVFISEFGADTIAGNHKLPETIFSEEYQVEYYKENFRALDDCDFMIGEHPWCFADFMTSEGLKRFDGNKKGIFTRQRQPKSVAFLIRDRWQNKK